MSTPVTLTGRLTAEPELRYAANGTPVAKFSVVTSRRVRDKTTGEYSDADTSFWDCVAFGQLAENVCAALTKGLAVIVCGKASQRSWEAKDGTKRRSIEVTADEVAPSLGYATAKVSQAERSASAREGSRSEADPWATAEPSGFSDSPPF